MFFNCTKIARPNNKPPMQKSNPMVRRLCPFKPKKFAKDTFVKSGSVRLASPPPDSCP